MNGADINSIYIIDDDPVMRISCQKILTKEGFNIETFEDGLQGLERIVQKQPSLIVVDLKMPKMGGQEVIARVHEMNPDIIIVVITGYATIDTAIDAMKGGAYDFLPKPFTPDELRIIVNRGIERSRLLEESNRLRQEKEKLQRNFITFVSHQLQSPLVAVQQYLDVLQHLGDLPEREKLQKEWIERSHIKIKELLELIRDWLKLSKIESGRLADKLKAVDILPIIADVVKTYEARAAENNINITWTAPAKVGAAKCDPDCFNVLISNLVVNAIKYNKPHGKITIDVQEDCDDIVIAVADTGIGIDKKDIELIFEEFTRVKNEQTKDISGTGLGLPICKKIITEIGGKINVHSVLHEGSTFTLHLPKYKD